MVGAEVDGVDAAKAEEDDDAEDTTMCRHRRDDDNDNDNDRDGDTRLFCETDAERGGEQEGAPESITHTGHTGKNERGSSITMHKSDFTTRGERRI